MISTFFVITSATFGGTTSSSTPIAPASCNSRVCSKILTALSAVLPCATNPPIQVAFPGTNPT